MLLAIAVAVAGAALLIGPAQLGIAQVAQALRHPDGAQAATIVWQLRLPRVIAGSFTGVCLALAGAQLQGLLRNPLVDPYLTGVSAGAAFAIVIALALGASLAVVPSLGFAAGLATALLVAALARRGAGLDPTRLILAGVSLSSLFAAAIALVLTRLQSTDAAPAIVGWLAGSLAGRGWSDLGFALPYAMAGVAIAMVAVPALNALRLGDVRAATLGVNVARTQWIVLCSASLLTAAAVALSGTVGFVGLIVPHVARRIVGSDARYLLVACALLGAALTTAADTVARTAVAPAEIPLGVLLAFIGVPAFLFLYLRERPVVSA